jgi:hypothetical protein
MKWRDSSFDDLICASLVAGTPNPSVADCRRARARLLAASDAQGRTAWWRNLARALRVEWAELLRVNPAEARYERARLNRSYLCHVQAYERRMMLFALEPLRFTMFSVIW